MQVDGNAVGDRGEDIVKILLTRRYGRTTPRFRPTSMGEKHPAIDFMVELVGSVGSPTPLFFAQVKATSHGVDTRGNVNIRVRPHQMSSLVTYPAPTHIVGVDETAEEAFILAALSGGAMGLSSLPARHSLVDEQTLIRLFDEVERFWQAHAAPFTVSQFI